MWLVGVCRQLDIYNLLEILQHSKDGVVQIDLWSLISMDGLSINACKWNALRVQFWKSHNKIAILIVT
jgi:hypothetical protein